ncbi:MAG: hypothetical protein LBL18_02115 [Bacteroidales bacterium]|jgi:hypothetical protein|nr:hypothetical protein [Bacteroidales bacterium]
MKQLIFMLIAACVLLASSCEKPKGLEVQNKPQRPGDTTVVVSPGDSILPPYMEKWIWVQYTDFSGCWPTTETYRRPKTSLAPMPAPLLLTGATLPTQAKAAKALLISKSYLKFRVSSLGKIRQLCL